MSMDELFDAWVELLPVADGGLKESMPLPTRSLLLVFESIDFDAPGEVQIGAHITSSERELLSPGDSLPVAVDFWSDLGRIYATQGAEFQLWYAGRVVGEGRVCGASHG